MSSTIPVADSGNLQIHIPMLICRVRGRKTVTLPRSKMKMSSGYGSRCKRRPPAPDIVEALINGEKPNGHSPATLTQTSPGDWAEQHHQHGFATDCRPDRW